MRFMMSRHLRDHFDDGPTMPAEAQLLTLRMDEVMRAAEVDLARLTRFENALQRYRRRRIGRVNLGGHNGQADRDTRFRRLYYERTKNEITFLTVGHHELWLEEPVSEVDQAVRELLADPVEIPNALLIPERRRGELRLDELDAAEVQPSWIYQLDGTQHRIAKSVRKRMDGPAPSLDLITGGPGTGKTAVLAWLLNKAVQDDHRSIRIAMSDAVADYVAHIGTWSRPDIGFDYWGCVGSYRPDEEVDLLFVDDPNEFLDLQDYADAIDEGRVRHAIVAVDYQQLDTMWTDDDIAALEAQSGVKRHRLTTCYRQKSKIGKPVKEILEKIAESTPSNNLSRVTSFYEGHRRQLTDATKLTFTNPGGDYNVKIGSRDQAWAELARLFKSKAETGMLWDWAPAILILRGDGVRYPRGGLGLFEDLPVVSHRLSDYELFKGLEFQHSVILLTQAEWSLLNRVQQGRPHAFEQQRLTRIGLTRARDSLTVIVT